MAFSLTAAALPILLRDGGRHQAERPPTVAAVAPGGGEIAAQLQGSTSSDDDSAPAPATASSVPATTADPPAFLVGATTAPGIHEIVIGIPTTLPPTSAVGFASFKHWGSTWVTNPCSAPGIKSGTKVSITDTDNGHVATCVVVDQNPVPAGQLIVLDASVFGQLADLVESPVPVQLTWK